MTAINNLIEELEEGVIAQRVGASHDNARVKYQLTSSTATDYDSFIDIIGDYYNYHFQQVHQCGPINRADARGKARLYLN